MITVKFDIRKIQLCEFEILNELDKVAKNIIIRYNGGEKKED